MLLHLTIANDWIFDSYYEQEEDPYLDDRNKRYFPKWAKEEEDPPYEWSWWQPLIFIQDTIEHYILGEPKLWMNPDQKDGGPELPKLTQKEYKAYMRAEYKKYKEELEQKEL